MQTPPCLLLLFFSLIVGLVFTSCQTQESEEALEIIPSVKVNSPKPGVDELLAGEFGEPMFESVGYLTDTESGLISDYCDEARHVKASNRLSSASTLNREVSDDLRNLRRCTEEGQYLMAVATKGCIAGKIASLWGLYLLDRDLYEEGLEVAEQAANSSGLSATWGEGADLQSWDWDSAEVDVGIQKIGIAIEFTLRN